MTRSTLEEWKAARTTLSDAIRSYQAASSTLYTVCTTPPCQSLERATIEESLMAIDPELESLEQEEAILQETRISLATIRNKSVTLAPVNKLPPDILAYVLALSRSYCVHSDTWNLAEFQGLTAISACWRQAAMSATDLWTHIDVGPEIPAGLANLLFERTKDRAVHVHICEPLAALRSRRPVPEDTTKKTINMLTPHIHRVCAWDITSNSDFSAMTGSSATR